MRNADQPSKPKTEKEPLTPAFTYTGSKLVILRIEEHRRGDLELDGLDKAAFEAIALASADDRKKISFLWYDRSDPENVVKHTIVISVTDHPLTPRKKDQFGDDPITVYSGTITINSFKAVPMISGKKRRGAQKEK